jgi:hypothetical protein
MDAETRPRRTRRPLGDDEAQIGATIPKWMRDALFARAKAEDRSASSVLRSSLKAFLGEPPRRPNGSS